MASEKKTTIIDIANDLTKAKTYLDSTNNITNLLKTIDNSTIISATRTPIGISELIKPYYPDSERHLQLLSDLTEKTKLLNETSQKLAQETEDKKVLIEERDKAIEDINTLKTKMHVISRVCEQARENIYKSEEFYSKFANEKSCKAVVVSIDIRRSTELMLKAKTPKDFSTFITVLSNKLSQCIIGNLGIFDKFTGDGILAFFPDFYSGHEAILRAIQAAEQCHKIFNEHYYVSRAAFNVFIKDVGLGIGIDYGDVTLVNTSNELTVVGIPVVYACRMSGAKAGDTILNYGAYQEAMDLSPNNITVEETEIVIKNEGTAMAYKVTLHPSVFVNMEAPDWLKEFMENHSAGEEVKEEKNQEEEQGGVVITEGKKGAKKQ